MFYATAFMSDLKPSDRSGTRVNLPRVGLLCLVALAMTAMWAAILYFASLLLGTPISIVVLAPILAVVFFLSLLGMGLAVSASGESNDDEGPEDDAA